MAERLGLGENVGAPLRQVFTRWDASGVPGGVGGEQLAPLVRLFHLAGDVLGWVETAGEWMRCGRPGGAALAET